MDIRDCTGMILEELRHTLLGLSSECCRQLVKAILDAETVFLAGAGRSGLAMRAFGMRLMHLGFRAYIVGQTVTPGVTRNDLLIVGSGSGSTDSLVGMAAKAKKIGAQIALLTITSISPLGDLADEVITIPAPSPKLLLETAIISCQPMRSLFEQSLWLTLDGLVLLLMKEKRIDAAVMFGRHANLE